MKKIKSFMFLLIILSLFNVFSQNDHEITGVISDDKNIALESAIVIIKPYNNQ